MKPIKKDAKRQQRRERALVRLEFQLAGGVKKQLVEKQVFNEKARPGERLKTQKVFENVPLTGGDIVRMENERDVLKQRLGRS